MNSTRTTRDVETVIKLVVKPGTPSGTLFRFEGHGHEEPGCTEIGDVVFEVKDAPHPYFRREHDNLIYTHRIFIRYWGLVMAMAMEMGMRMRMIMGMRVRLS